MGSVYFLGKPNYKGERMKSQDEHRVMDSAAGAYFRKLTDDGYKLSLQGSLQGGFEVDKEHNVSLAKEFSLPKEVVAAAEASGASDERIGIAALLKQENIARPSLHLVATQAQAKNQAFNDALGGDETNKTPGPQ